MSVAPAAAPPALETPALETVALVAGYEPGLPIVKEASIAVAPGEIHALFGPNGAGKSTLAKAIAGLVPIASGEVALAGEPIRGVPAHAMIRRGLAFVPQTENIFAGLTVAENIDLAAALLKKDRRRSLAAMEALFPDLARLGRLQAGRLSGGQRQMLACARALVAEPKVLILDEPSAGLSPKLVDTVFDRLRAVKASGVTILLVEQNVKAALGLADRATVLVDGRQRMTASAEAFADPEVLAGLYFGPRRAA
jgi:branched-chain amino acid transport system ATP-binding protein